MGFGFHFSLLVPKSNKNKIIQKIIYNYNLLKNFYVYMNFAIYIFNSIMDYKTRRWMEKFESNSTCGT